MEDDTEELSAPFFSYRRNDGSHRPVAKTKTWVDGRETNVRLRLTQGKYCIVPCTYMPGSEGDFILRIHIERYSNEDLSDDGREPLALEHHPDNDIILPRPRTPAKKATT